jgi:predicted transglutaminase-like cysteine proteinase
VKHTLTLSSWVVWLLSACAITLAFGQDALLTVTDQKIAALTQVFGATAQKRLLAWRALMTSTENRALPERNKLELVNDFMNQTPYVSDLEQWGKPDYWAIPVEFLSTDGGDGEDFAIAKYFTLLALGVPDDKLLLTYVQETKVIKQAHMVLSYYEKPDAEPLILDNFDKTLQPASARTDLTPVYGFNGTGLWQAKSMQQRAQPENSPDSLPQWKDIRRRMKAAS